MIGGYAAAATAILAARAESEDPLFPLNLLLLARAAEAVGAVSASQDLRAFGVAGKRLLGVADLYPLARIPGVRFQQLTSEPGFGSFVVDSTDIPPQLVSEFRSWQISGIIGGNNANCLANLRDLWDTRLRRCGFWSATEVDRAIAIVDGGVLAYPQSAKSLQTQAPGLPSDMLQPEIDGAQNQASYDAICQVFYDVIYQYNHANIAQAAAAVRASNARADFWDSTLYVVTAIRDAPGNAVKATASYAGGALWETLKGNWPAVALVVLGVGLYLFRHKLPGLAKAGATKAVGAIGGKL